jgi:hypothetical protein
MNDPLIRDISDTARWMAVYRARETRRSDAVFRDPFAKALAGERGEQIAKSTGFGEENDWPFVARTYLFDQIITTVAVGADLILNLAAGLDTRPYRMDLPSSLRWVEVDLPEILDYKEAILGDAKPACTVERVRLDLSNSDARRGLFARLGRSAANVLVISEGLVIYLMPAEVAALAALGRRYRVAGITRHAQEADGRRGGRSGRAVSVRSSGRTGVLRTARVEGGAGAVDPEDRGKARTAAAGPADVRDAAGIVRTAGLTPLVGGVSPESGNWMIWSLRNNGEPIPGIKAQALIELGERQINAIARNYYLSSAMYLLKDLPPQ